MNGRVVQLRTAITTINTIACGLALVVSATLVVLTTFFQEVNRSAVDAVESVRLVDEAEIALLRHVRTDDPIARHEFEADLRDRLAAAAVKMTTVDELEALRVANESIDRYLAAARDPAIDDVRLDELEYAAYKALDALVGSEGIDAKEAHREVEFWNDVADTMGTSVALLALLLTGGVTWWLNARAFRPLLEVAGTLERYRKGDRAARIPETGPPEIRRIAARFNEMAAALAVQREQLMAFLGGVAHDLRNPLAALQSAIGVIRCQVPVQPKAEEWSALDAIDRQLALLARMIQDLLDVTRIEAGRLALDLVPLDARSLLKAAIPSLRETAAHHPLRVALPDEPVPILGDDVRLAQVLTNLVSNAAKYSPKASPIDVALAIAGAEAAFVVIDRGLGIAEDERDRIFEPFHRVDLSEESVPGTGLGLFVVREIVRAHGGRVELESAPGRGSTFRVLIPLFRDLLAPAPLAPSASAPAD